MIKYFLLCVSFVMLSGCVSGISSLNVSQRQVVFEALNSQQDGYKSVVGEKNDQFVIHATLANDSKLCRIVSFEEIDRFTVESLCKSKGGRWY